ncbi:abortive infection family protein [Massilia sp. RP-1-19]|uniref:Abortive infection family protein n=1 Tax=Massilia polaris TaxID=2728846 RepID=A0A848HR80_9BURK|nr:abortive infection family protein [Massilia polaris]NML63477.1 abortive infection family protein [Massilia polaris]
MENSQEFEQVLATVTNLLSAEGFTEAAELVRRAPARVEITGWDNWNGGINLWTVSFSIDASDYAKLGSRRQTIEEQISKRLAAVIEQFTGDSYSVKIVPQVETCPDWRAAPGQLPEEVRRTIIDGFALDNVSWSGRLDEVAFLARLYDLKSFPSTDHRFPDASGDIWQHRINNPTDWDDDWVFCDPRFNLLSCRAELFLRFLCEVVHPVVRPDRDAALSLVKQFNDQLRPVAWELFEDEKIAGRQRFSFRQLLSNGQRAVSRARTVADALDAGWMQKEIERLEHSIERDPALAIGTAKELVESCCKSILSKRGIEYSRGADLGDLTKLLCKELRLVPENITDEAKGAENIRLILRNLTQVTHNLAQLRGLYGSGHGRDGQHRGLQARHARLAVASAVAFIDFVSETYHERGQLTLPN